MSPPHLDSGDAVQTQAHSLYAPSHWTASFWVACVPQNNNFSGRIPHLAGYSVMHMLRLGNNNLSGSIPATIKNVPLMTNFFLPFNK